ncbi:hypothetical protein HJFPF1_06888 [Paramyrothecium foliicola]|nr:hypothetical protein HJFPF1_06888 [Paramyrothecium foliicola]
MSPTNSQPQASEAMELKQQTEQPVQTNQPRVHQGMEPFPIDPQRPHDEPEVNLRGGEQGRGCCPGRFCFCIPCPLPCNCCIIPL